MFPSLTAILRSFGRYFFKTECPDFETGVIQEEVTEDSAPLPLWEGKVHGQVMTRE